MDEVRIEFVGGAGTLGIWDDATEKTAGII